MLVLTRKLGESIRIGDDIDVVILEVSKGRVRIGFTAPQSVSVRRTELLSRSEPQKAPAGLREVAMA